MPKSKFKRIVKNQTNKFALEYLNLCKSRLNKVKDIQFNELKMANYLLPSGIEVSINLAKFIVKIQTRMIEEVKANFKQKYEGNMLCGSCFESECNQPHLLECPNLLGANEMVTYIPNYCDIFGEDISEQIYIAQLMSENLRRKKELEQK